MKGIFDQIASTGAVQNAPTHDNKKEENSSTGEIYPETELKAYTPVAVKGAIQELLKYGILEADRKPNLYRTVQVDHPKIDQALEPLDLKVRLDDIRGLAFLVVAEKMFTEDDEWSHPLIRRQRLTLEQSLLVAILREYYIIHEQEAGIGAGDARVDLEDLLTRLQSYLGDTGSDIKDEKRLRNLLEKLKGHGIVSEINAKGQVTIRPIITHLANPENLQHLLIQYRKMAEAEGETGFEEEVSQ